MKFPGLCSKCSTPVYEVTRTHPEGHPYAGKPARLGRKLPNCRKATFVTLEGNQMDLSLCEDCAAGLKPSDYPMLWREVLASWEVGVMVANAQDRDPARIARRTEVMQRLGRQPIVGLLGVAQ